MSGAIYSGGATGTLVLTNVANSYTNYQYRVVATNSWGNITSNEVLLTVQTPFTVPSTLSTTAITLNAATLNWANVPGATDVRIALRKVGTTQWYFRNAPYADSYTYNSSTGFSQNATYEWKVRVSNGTCWGDWSAIDTYSTCSGDAPTALNATNIFSNKVTLNWTHTAADEIRIALRKVGNANWLYYNGAYANSYVWNAAFTKNASYEWQIRVKCGGVWGPWSSISTFTSGTVAGMITQEENNSYEANNDAELVDFTLDAYPNPNDGNFTISASFDGTFNIVNELGQLIQQVTITKESNYEAKVENVQRGVYFVTGIINNQIITKRIVVN